MNRKAHGFTIVELLIVIVVIAILAAISVAAYTNIQQRAKNTAIINAASQSLKMIEAYVAQYGEYPAKSTACITIESECQADSNNDTKISGNNVTFTTNMATIGTLPKSVPTEGARLYGVTYFYSSGLMLNAESSPAFIRYHLLGKNQQCGLSGVMASSATSGANTYSTSGYTVYNASLDRTMCFVSIPGPTHS